MRREPVNRESMENNSTTSSTHSKADQDMENPISGGDAVSLTPRFVAEERESFVVQFAKTRGPPQITVVMVLIAIGLGSTIGVVPAVMSERFARLRHGYDLDTPCASFPLLQKPDECFQGSGDAQNAATAANLVSNALSFVTSSLIGSLSDEYGRKSFLLLGICISIGAPLLLFLTQLIPTMSPWWYYSWQSLSGVVSWMAIAMSAIADVLPYRLRAPGIGLLMAGFMLGFSMSPVLSFCMSSTQLSLMSCCVVTLGLFATIVIVPETLSPEAAAAARRTHELRSRHVKDQWGEGVLNIILRPFVEMSILNRDAFFRTISALAFFSGMVTTSDHILLIYYLEERLGFTARDIGVLFMIAGLLGLLVQGLLIKPLNEAIGEKMILVIAFLAGAIDNTMYGVATNKTTVFSAVAISSLATMAFPTISAIKANNVHETEQGRIQGALFSLQALAAGTGPVALRYIYSISQDTILGPGTMFVCAGLFYLVAVLLACVLSSDRANSSRSHSQHVHDDNDLSLRSDSDENTTVYNSMGDSVPLVQNQI
eukprot:Nitzschia sp. Nitz4//scaffold336_size18528//12918//14618//NITZ4_008776-RA/size18528-snap-gene-0.2-mRNA-1//-1//CDS//3329548295//6713//frame0